VKFTFVFIIAFVVCTTSSNAQPLSTKNIEDDLVREYSKLSAFGYNHNYDSIVYQDSVFRNKIAAYTQRYDFTLTYPFKILIDSGDINIVTSDDELFRIYSWDTWSGGTMHLFNNIFQFKSGNNVCAKLLYDSSNGEDGRDPLSNYSAVYTLRADGKIYYLCIDHTILSSSDFGQSIKIFSITNNELINPPLIKTETGIESEVFIEYDFSSSVNQSENSPKDIKYDAAKKIIYIPLVLKDGKVTNRFIKYQFTGKYFERIKP
jgi:hypothetical protein